MPQRGECGGVGQLIGSVGLQGEVGFAKVTRCNRLQQPVAGAGVDKCHSAVSVEVWCRCAYCEVVHRKCVWGALCEMCGTVGMS